MTKKDYERLSSAILKSHADKGGSTLYRDGVLQAALCVADALAVENNCFQEVRFLRACGFASRPDGSYEVANV